ncbi:MAG: polyhydroxyalkanoic acid system family protein [Betaproteobacteria bacterium]
MADIKYVRAHSLPLDQARQIAQQTADDLAEEYNLVSEWDGDTLHFHRSGVEGQMQVTSRQIALEVKLGFLLRPFKSAFEMHIENHLEQRLGGVTAAADTAKTAAKSAAKSVAKTAAKTAAKAAAKKAVKRKG